MLEQQLRPEGMSVGPGRLMTTDEQLMAEFQQGSRPAFAELFHRYRESIYGFFRRRLNDAARAEELAQETFLAVLHGAARYEPRALFRTYLYAIALNLLAAERRKKEGNARARKKRPSQRSPRIRTPRSGSVRRSTGSTRTRVRSYFCASTSS